MEKRDHLSTEKRHPKSEDLDLTSPSRLVDLMAEETEKAAKAVRSAREEIQAVIEEGAESIDRGGRLFYVGAGTSGRLGVLDASECPPTFSTDPETVQGIIAGGSVALVESKEGAEDRPEDGARALREKQVDELDVVVGISTGGTTPYVLGAMKEAKQRNAYTAFISCVSPEQSPVFPDEYIELPTGPEILTGSTRLKAGTATKVVLNTISTGIMMELGKVYKNYMVDLKVNSQKLRDRGMRILEELTDLSYDEAGPLLDRAEGDVKMALVMQKKNLSREEAEEELKQAEGNLRKILH